MSTIENAVFDAARTGDRELLTELINKGADINARDPRGFTPLIVASYNDQLEATTLLLEAGADVNARMPAEIPRSWVPASRATR